MIFITIGTFLFEIVFFYKELLKQVLGSVYALVVILISVCVLINLKFKWYFIDEYVIFKE